MRISQLVCQVPPKHYLPSVSALPPDAEPHLEAGRYADTAPPSAAARAAGSEPGMDGMFAQGS